LYFQQKKRLEASFHIANVVVAGVGIGVGCFGCFGGVVGTVAERRQLFPRVQWGNALHFDSLHYCSYQDYFGW
jgi:hypothetical protein